MLKQPHARYCKHFVQYSLFKTSSFVSPEPKITKSLIHMPPPTHTHTKNPSLSPVGALLDREGEKKKASNTNNTEAELSNQICTT